MMDYSDEREFATCGKGIDFMSAEVKSLMNPT
jgi:hypothetical protein